MKIQHEDTGYITEIPDNQPIPRRWFKIPDPKPTKGIEGISKSFINNFAYPFPFNF